MSISEITNIKNKSNTELESNPQLNLGFLYSNHDNQIKFEVKKIKKEDKKKENPKKNQENPTENPIDSMLNIKLQDYTTYSYEMTPQTCIIKDLILEFKNVHLNIIYITKLLKIFLIHQFQNINLMNVDDFHEIILNLKENLRFYHFLSRLNKKEEYIEFINYSEKMVCFYNNLVNRNEKHRKDKEFNMKIKNKNNILNNKSYLGKKHSSIDNQILLLINKINSNIPLKESNPYSSTSTIENSPVSSSSGSTLTLIEEDDLTETSLMINGILRCGNERHDRKELENQRKRLVFHENLLSSRIFLYYKPPVSSEISQNECEYLLSKAYENTCDV